MKIDRQIVLYLLIIFFLVLGIAILWPKTKGQNVLLDSANRLVSGKKITVVDNTDESIVINPSTQRIVDGIEEIDKNIVGEVKSWDGNSNLLTVIIKDKQADFVVDPTEAQVLISSTKNDGKDTSLKPITKSADSQAWKSAFCIDDSVSLLVRPETNSVRVVINSGRRICGK